MPRRRAAVEAHIPMGRAAEPGRDRHRSSPSWHPTRPATSRARPLYACGGLTLYGDFADNWAS